MSTATLLLGLLLAFCTVSPVSSEDIGETSAADPFAAIWLLDPGLSHYADDAVPEQMYIVIDEAKPGLHYRSRLITAGRVAGSEFTAALDGSTELVRGSRRFEAPVSLRRLDDRTIEAVYVRKSRPVAFSRWSISHDARELTVTTNCDGVDGRPLRNVAVFRRADEAQVPHLLMLARAGGSPGLSGRHTHFDPP